MPDYALMEILVQVRGEHELAKLQERLQIVRDSTLDYSYALKVASKQMELEVATLQRSNIKLEARSKLKNEQLNQLARQRRMERQYTAEFERRMAIEDRALEIQFNSKEIISDKNARLMAEEQIAKEAADAKFIEGERIKQAELNQTRKSLMAASISMFVLNISMGQLVTSLKPFVKGNEAATEALDNVSDALRFSMAPLQAYMALKMIDISLTKGQTIAYIKLATAMGSVFFWFMAIKEKSPGLRAAYFGIAAALTAVSIATWMADAGLAVGKALLGDYKSLGILVGGAAIMAGIIGGMTAPKAQTLTGHRKRVRVGGLAQLDDDEVVTRESKDTTKSGSGITIYLPDSYTGSLSDARITAETVRRYTQTGQGPVKFRRRVASNG